MLTIGEERTKKEISKGPGLCAMDQAHDPQEMMYSSYLPSGYEVIEAEWWSVLWQPSYSEDSNVRQMTDSGICAIEEYFCQSHIP